VDGGRKDRRIEGHWNQKSKEQAGASGVKKSGDAAKVGDIVVDYTEEVDHRGKGVVLRGRKRGGKKTPL